MSYTLSGGDILALFVIGFLAFCLFLIWYGSEIGQWLLLRRQARRARLDSSKEL